MDPYIITPDKINWNDLAQKELNGSSGTSLYKESFCGGYRVRLAEYSTGYESKDWCDEPHIIHCLSGQAVMFFRSGKQIEVKAGDTLYLPAADPHMAKTGSSEVTLFVIDTGVSGNSAVSNLDTAKKYYEGWETGSKDLLKISPGLSFTSPDLELTGSDRFFEKCWQYSGVPLQNKQFIAQGDTVCIKYEMKMPDGTGKHFCEWLTFRGGIISEIRVFY